MTASKSPGAFGPLASQGTTRSPYGAQATAGGRAYSSNNDFHIRMKDDMRVALPAAIFEAEQNIERAFKEGRELTNSIPGAVHPFEKVEFFVNSSFSHYGVYHCTADHVAMLRRFGNNGDLAFGAYCQRMAIELTRVRSNRVTTEDVIHVLYGTNNKMNPRLVQSITRRALIYMMRTAPRLKLHITMLPLIGGMTSSRGNDDEPKYDYDEGPLIIALMGYTDYLTHSVRARMGDTGVIPRGWEQINEMFPLEALCSSQRPDDRYPRKLITAEEAIGLWKAILFTSVNPLP